MHSIQRLCRTRGGKTRGKDSISYSNMTVYHNLVQAVTSTKCGSGMIWNIAYPLERRVDLSQRSSVVDTIGRTRHDRGNNRETSCMQLAKVGW